MALECLSPSERLETEPAVVPLDAGVLRRAVFSLRGRHEHHFAKATLELDSMPALNKEAM